MSDWNCSKQLSNLPIFVQELGDMFFDYKSTTKLDNLQHQKKINDRFDHIIDLKPSHYTPLVNIHVK